MGNPAASGLKPMYRMPVSFGPSPDHGMSRQTHHLRLAPCAWRRFPSAQSRTGTH